MARPRLLHIFSTFNLGGPQMRAVQLLNSWGDQFVHEIVSVSPDELAAVAGLSRTLDVHFPEFPSFKEGALPQRLWRVRERLHALKPDLLLTYNWGAIEAVLAARLFGGPPIVHHEDGFGPDEVDGQLSRRIWIRRIALPVVHRVIVPSRTLERAARSVWRVSQGRLRCIPNGVDVDLFRERRPVSALAGVVDDGSLLVGTVAGLRREKNLPRLVRTFAGVARTHNARLVIVGTGPEKEAIIREAQALGVADRVHLTGFLPDPHRYVGAFDIFALSSDTEQFPISLVEAMAAGSPAVCTNVGDIAEIVAAENLEFVIAREDEAGLTDALRKLLDDRRLRETIGQANCRRAAREFSLQGMSAAYQEIYRAAIVSRMNRGVA